MTTLNRQRKILAEIVEVEHHAHNRERWFGKSADQSGNDWAADNLTPYRTISGNGVYGADANDEAKIFGTLDTPVRSGMVKFDVHRILLTAVSNSTPWKLRLVYGTGTMAAAIVAEQYTEFMVEIDSANPQQSGGAPVDIVCPRISAGTKVWIQGKNGTDNATIDYFVGIHEYEA